MPSAFPVWLWPAEPSECHEGLPTGHHRQSQYIETLLTQHWHVGECHISWMVDHRDAEGGL